MPLLTRLALAAALTFAGVSVAALPPTLTAPVVAEKVTAQEVILLDIRSPAEWAETGVAEGAWPVTMHDPGFPAQLQSILSRFGPERVALICATGGRSAYLAEILEKNGISGVQDVSEGMLGNGTDPGWIARGMPLVSAAEAQERFDRLRQDWK